MLNILLFIIGITLLTAGAAWLVSGAARLAGLLGVPALITGLTIVAFGTSAPELVVSAFSAARGQPDVAVGNVLGSNIFNVLFILGVSALIVPLMVARQLVRIDVPLLIVFSAVGWGFTANGTVSTGEGLVLLALLVLYTIMLGLLGRRGEIPEEGLASAHNGPTRAVATGPSLLYALGGVFFGLAMLALGAHWVVEGAVGLARLWGVPESVIGVTLVAMGTSLPEAATSVVAAIRRQRDIAVGNIVGSNIFNLLGVLGVAAVVAPDGLGVAEAFCRFDVPIMAAVAIVCLPIFISGSRISRTEGGLLLFYYVLYVGLKVLRTEGSAYAGAVESTAVYGLLPATALLLVVSLARSQHELTELAREVAQNVSGVAAYSVRNARKLVVLVTSGTVLLVGLALLFLPGPGTVVLFVGLAMLATEFVWARRLIKRMRDQVEGAAHYLRGTEGSKEPAAETRADPPPSQDGGGS